MTTETQPVPRPDGRRVRGDRSRRAILDSAARLASMEGLEGLSIGRLAEHVGMSKSGLYAHFRSKEELQLSTIAAADEIYAAAILEPALAMAPGRDRVLALCYGFLDFVASGELPGGCFFVASSLDPATKREPVRAALNQSMQQWLDLVTGEIDEAQKSGEVSRDLPAAELALELEAILVGVDVLYVMFADRSHLDQAKAAIRRRLT
jgi:AcrR family transcriptional regulator